MSPLLALVESDLRRLVRPAVRVTLFGIAALVVAWILDARQEILGGIVAVIGASILFTQPGEILRDRMTRGLEFMLGLPIEPGLIVAARFGFIFLLALPVAGVWILAAEVAGWQPLPYPLLFLVLWALAGAGTCVWLAFGMAADLQTFTSIPFVLIIGSMVIGELLERFVPDAGPAFARWLLRTTAAGGLPYLFLLINAGMVAGAYAFAVHGLRRYRPDPGGEELVGHDPHAILLRRHAAKG